MRQMISRLNQLSLGVHRVNETMARHDLSYGGVGKLVFLFLRLVNIHTWTVSHDKALATSTGHS